ncbi:hypothetical protein ACFTZI_29015 [Streptomyces decoyicus]|uniref:hypothetical protein n=1 Tax=Streptomyces decoyicus TaxID=249567 RepID=UPI00363A3A09
MPGPAIEALAERLPHSVRLRGDTFRRTIVRGQIPMTPDAEQHAVDQLRLRYRLTAHCADAYAQAGLTVLAQDILIGDHLAGMTGPDTSRQTVDETADEILGRARTEGAVG